MNGPAIQSFTKDSFLISMIAPSRLERFKVSNAELKKLGTEFYSEALPLLNNLYTVSFWIVLDKSSTKKIIRQIFKEAIEYCNVTKNEAGWQSWILRIWMREIIDFYSSNKNDTNTVFDFIDHAEIFTYPEGSTFKSYNLKSVTGAKLLVELLSKLPEVLRIPLIMKEIFRYDYEKIAKLIDVPTGVIATRIYRARKLLFLFAQKNYPYEQEKKKWESQPPSKKIFEIRNCARYADEEMNAEEYSTFSKYAEENPEYKSEINVQLEIKKTISNCSQDDISILKLKEKILKAARKKFGIN